MQDLPHHYDASARIEPGGHVTLSSDGVASIESAAPREFGGPGDRWSPESLLVAAVADCFVLSFKAIARASKLEWLELRCEVEGVLDKVDRVIRFTAFEIVSSLSVPAGTDEAKATRLLERAEAACLITNSLLADKSLVTKVTVAS